MKVIKVMHKILCLALVVSLILPASLPVFAADLSENLVLAYDFSAINAGKIADISNNGKDATVVGDVTIADGKASFNGGHLLLPNNLLDGMEEITVTGWVYRGTNQNYERFFDFGTGTSDYFSLSLPRWDGKALRTEVATGGSVKSFVETSPVPSQIWTYVTATLSKGELAVYINGEKKASVASVLKPGDITGSTKNYLGKSQYAADLDFLGKMDDLEIYNKVLSETEINERMNKASELVDPAKLSKAMNDFKFNVTEADKDIDLPQKTGDVKLSWKSGDTKILSDDGKIVSGLAYGRHQVALTVTGELGGFTESKSFNVTVVVLDDAQSVQEAYDALGVPTLIETDYAHMPKIGKYNTKIEWTSSNPNVISTDGDVTRPEVGAGPTYVDLTATITKGSSKLVKNFPRRMVMEKYVAYLLTYFGGDEKAAGNEEGFAKVHFAISYDALNWYALNDNKYVVSATVKGSENPDVYGTSRPNECLARDPVVYREQDGQFRLLSSHSWYNPSIYVWDKGDLTSFSKDRIIKIRTDLNENAFAPEVIYDPVKEKHLIISSDPQNTVGNSGWGTYTTDFTQADIDAHPEDVDIPLMKDAKNINGSKYLDCSIASYKGKFIMAYSEHASTGQTIATATADYIGPDSFNVIGRLDPNEDEPAEGPFIFKDNNRERWYLYYDFFHSGGEFGCSYTDDLINGEWTHIPPSEVTMPYGVTHGNAIPITQGELNKLIDAWGINMESVDKPNTIFADAETSVEELNLPKTVKGHRIDGVEIDIPVTWDTTSYTGAKGKYTLTGKLDVPENIENRDVFKTVDINIYAGYSLSEIPLLSYDFKSVNDGFVLDGSERNNHAKIEGDVTVKDGVADFNGGYLKLPDNLLSGLDGITVMGWVRRGTAQKHERFFDLGTGQNEYFSLSLNNWDGTTIRAEVKKGELIAANGKAVSPEDWTHVAVSLGNGKMSVYVDGVLIRSAETTIKPSDISGANNFLGKSQFADPNFIGKMKDVAIYGDVLSADAIAEQMKGIYTDAKNKLTVYRESKSNDLYRAAQITELDAAVQAGLTAIDNAEADEIDTELANAKAALDAVKTDAQLIDEYNAAHPTLISSLNELTAFANTINNSADGGAGLYWKLTTDIDFNGGKLTTTIGTMDKPFRGTFDGDGHVIKNYKIDADGVADKLYGVFGVIAGNAVIKNVGIQNSGIYKACTTIAYSESLFGGLVAKMIDNTKVQNCFSRNVTVHTQDPASNWANFTGDHLASVGGLIGTIDGGNVVIENCYSIGFKELNDSGSANGAIAGGMPAGTIGRMENCYAIGNIAMASSLDIPKFVNCYATNTTGWSPYGLMPGTNKSEKDMLGIETLLGDAFKEGANYNNGYPILSWEPIPLPISGTGTKDDPYIVSTVENLIEASLIPDTKGKYFELTNDIDLENKTLSTYIGSYGVPFEGIFDGKGHIIKNFNINVPAGNWKDGANGKLGLGIFGAIGGDAIVKNIGVENVYITSTGGSGWNSVAGGLVGYVLGNATVDSCYVKDTLVDTKANEATINVGAGGAIAGLVEGIGATISNCFSLGFVEKNDSIATEDGLIGQVISVKSITNCYSDTTFACVANDYTSKVTNSYALAKAHWAPGGYARTGQIITDAQLKGLETTLGSAFKKGNVNTKGFPALSWEAEGEGAEGEGTETAPYIIANLDNLVEVATMADTEGKNFKLTADIDMNGVEWKNYIGTNSAPFKGTFDGNGHVIKNFKIVIPASHSFDNWSYGAGLFGYVGGNAIIKNLGVEDVTVGSSVNSWRECAGGIAGIVDGNAKISECYVKNIENTDLTAPELMAIGAIAAATVGDGVVIENCYSISNDFKDKVDYDGGIVGFGKTFSKIENCYSTNGIVRAEKSMADKVVNCYNIGVLGWPLGDTGSTQTYLGETISIIQLRASANALGDAFKTGGVETKGFPALNWETITEITLTTVSEEVPANVTDFVFVTEFEMTKDDEIVLSFGNTSVDGIQLLSLTENEITVGRKFNAGGVQKGTYKVVADFDFSHKVILLTITMPDGSIYKRGDSELLCGLNRADIVSITSIEEDAVKGAYIYRADYDEAREIVYDEEPQFNGFDALVYNFSSSYDVDAKTTRNFAWMADLSFDAMDVMYKAEGETEWQTVNAVREEAQTAQYQYAYYYKADLTDLTPGTTYTYKYGKAGSTAEADWSREYTFTTEKENVKEFNFAVVSDTQGKTWDEFKYTKEVMDAIKDVNPALIMHAGDIVEVAGNDDQWPPFFKAIKDIAHGTPFFFAPGNHDTWSNEQWDSSPMNKDFMFGLHFNHPNNGGMAAIKDLTPEDLNVANKSGRRLVENMDEAVYSYDYGDVHFVVLTSGTGLGGSYGYADDNKVLKAQRDWLIADLEANKDAKWTVLMMHMPVYAQFFDFESKTVLTDIIDKYEIDLVLTGHDHSVSRTHAVRNGEIVDKGEIGYIKKGEGTVYSILGAVTPLHRDHISDGDQVYEVNMLSVGPEDTMPVYTVINVTDEKLEVTTKLLNGFVVDNYKIVADEIQIAGLTRFNGEKVNTIADLAIDGYADLGFYYNGGDAKDLAVMAAYYDADNKLVGIHKLENTTTTAEEDLYSYIFIPTDVEGVEEIKFFVWDTTNSLMPITKKVFSLK